MVDIDSDACFKRTKVHHTRGNNLKLNKYHASVKHRTAVLEWHVQLSQEDDRKLVKRTEFQDGWWLGGLLVEHRTSVSQIRGSIPGQVAAV